MSGLISLLGYKRYSPYKDNPYLMIDTPSGRITMEDVDEPLLAVSNHGEVVSMQPGEEYQFKGDRVLEIPRRPRNKREPYKHPERYLTAVEAAIYRKMHEDPRLYSSKLARYYEQKIEKGLHSSKRDRRLY